MLDNLTALEAAREFINVMPSSFEKFIHRHYELTLMEASQVTERLLRELDARIERERQTVAAAGRILANCPDETEAA